MVTQIHLRLSFLGWLANTASLFRNAVCRQQGAADETTDPAGHNWEVIESR